MTAIPLRATGLARFGIALGLVALVPGFAQADDAGRDEFFWLGEMNKATAVINSEAGLLPKDKVPAIAAAITKVLADGSQPGAKRPSTVISFEPLLIKAGGVEVTLLHAGRSSQDMHATYRAAILRDDLLSLAKQLEATTRTLVDLADRHRETIVPNYTNGVAAQPNSYAHYLLGHAAGFGRDAERIREAYARVDRSAMGTTVLNGTGWPLDRDRMAGYLGFAGIVDNAYDASQISSMEHPVEVGSIVTSIALHTGHFIEDVMTQYAQTRPWILLEEGGGNTYVSSAMPQKRNPGLLNSTRSDASAAIALALGPILQAHNITPGMNDPKDVEANSAVVAAGVETLAGLDKVLKGLMISPERALEELNSDWTASQEIADILMRDHGLPFREGHHVASEIVTYARANGIKPLDFPFADAQRIYAETVKGTAFPQVLPMTEAEFRAALDPAAIVRNRTTRGGPQPVELERMIVAARQNLDAQATWIGDRRAHIDAALARLDKDFASLSPK
ncbi:argininosuccinate lyase [Aureimonas phyllosphaerae]|uniref:Argininosuccinate lyase n=1 Tax=Aureimonas phyllosphaerae TaxID=1166078 RepID=A0A7W6FUJ2_9HYPH|nr:argininosuccinate lyase [Aureimonas phyllosphaerae]MBB3936136.1 argininosuccinate lyase [Aureimonas phyllosphaerae]MBB3960139.1 argininosuccinate lyase [Aureimonas phyllosphaerae]SFF33656.1 argininosuccinate lyase [Aureimonas phyllosphaerae]